ncbi:MAG: aminotransferase class III-fold pyridoxal phosphate-dependent enzyme [Phycisphaerales bacterium]
MDRSTMESTMATGVSNTGEDFRNSPAVRGAVDAIIGELEARRAQITDVCGPRSPEARLTFERYMETAASGRGRALVYPHIGSGFGNGALIELMDGSVKFDMITGIGVHFFGHSNPGVVRAALNAAMQDVPMQGHLMMNKEAIEFAEVLLGQARRGSRLEHAFLCNSGAMANENALKVCMQKFDGAAPRVLAFAHCFMGRTLTMAQIGDSAGGRQGLPLSTMVDYMPFFDRAAAKHMSAGDVSGSTRYIDMAVWHLEQYIARYPKQHACFVFELVQGEGGFNTAPPEFHRALMQVCKGHGIPVWDDEVQTFGRTTEMFCFDTYGLGDMIDIVTVGKMSQVCAALFTSDLNPKPGLLSATFLGSSGALHVGKHMLETLRDTGFYGQDGRIARHHALFREQAEALIARHPDWFPDSPAVVEKVGGIGGMMRFTPFGGRKDLVTKLARTAFDEGVVLFFCGHDPYHIRMLPPLGAMQDEQWPRVFELLESAMAKVAAGA